MSHSSDMFKAAHRIAKAVHIKGDCYAVTFAAGLKQAYAMVKAIVARKAGDLTPINAAQVAMLVDVDGLSLTGECVTGEGKYSEGMHCSKPSRMAQYMLGLFDGVISHNLTLEVESGCGTVTYKVVK